MFKSTRHIVASVGALVTIQGILFSVIERTYFSLAVMLLGVLIVACGLHVELLAAINQAKVKLQSLVVRVKASLRARTEYSSRRKASASSEKGMGMLVSPWQLRPSNWGKYSVEPATFQYIPYGNRNGIEIRARSGQMTDVPFKPSWIRVAYTWEWWLTTIAFEREYVQVDFKFERMPFSFYLHPTAVMAELCRYIVTGQDSIQSSFFQLCHGTESEVVTMESCRRVVNTHCW